MQGEPEPFFHRLCDPAIGALTFCYVPCPATLMLSSQIPFHFPCPLCAAWKRLSIYGKVFSKLIELLIALSYQLFKDLLYQGCVLNKGAKKAAVTAGRRYRILSHGKIETAQPA